jgi:predicted NACHT family NTPase
MVMKRGLIQSLLAALEHVAGEATDLTVGAGAVALLSALGRLVEENPDSESVENALEAIRTQGDRVLYYLKSEHQRAIDKLDPGRIAEEFIAVAEQLYLNKVARSFESTDFNGILVDRLPVRLRLDEAFVNLKIRPSRRAALPPTEEGIEREPPQDIPAEVEHLLPRKPEDDPGPVDQFLAQPGGLVLLGGPGSGKTTLLKRLARPCGVGEEALRERFPKLPAFLFPVVVPITSFSHWREKAGEYKTVLDFIEHYLRDISSEALVQAFNRRFGFGHCLILLDGLDEVASRHQRVASARAGDFADRGLQRMPVVGIAKPLRTGAVRSGGCQDVLPSMAPRVRAIHERRRL